MALVTCVECKKEISSSVKVCPHCGKKDPMISDKDIAIGLLAIIGICLIFAIYFNFSSDSDNKSAKRDSVNEKKTSQSNLENEKDLYARAVKTPSTDLITNRDLYMKLTELNRDSKLYREKYQYYDNLVKAENKKEHEKDKKKRTELIRMLVREGAITIDKGRQRVYVETGFWNTMNYSEKEVFCSLITKSLEGFTINDKYTGKQLAHRNFIGETSIEE